MDIYKFINSKDIAEYLKSLNYEFTLPEAAFLVYQSYYRTMKDKFDAWRKLIDTMPDCSMEERFNMARILSFHQFLRDYMNLQDKMMQTFYDADGAVYTCELLQTESLRTWKSGSEFDDHSLYHVETGKYFADAGSAMEHFEKNREEYLEDGLQRVRFIKQPLLNKSNMEKNYEFWIEMTSDLEIIEIDYTGTGVLNDEDDTLFRQFDGMCFAFPTPFKRGDILIDRVRGGFAGPGIPFVLDSISTWSRSDLLNNGYTPHHPRVKSADKDLAYKLKNGDDTDMNYAYYYLSSEGMGFPVISSDNEYTYLNLERYEDSLQGLYRVLKPLSSAMTFDPYTGRNLIDTELLCNAYQLILNEEMSRYNRTFLEKDYTEEGLTLAGLK